MIFLKIIVVETLLFLFQNSSDLSTPESFPAFLTRKGLLQISPEFQVLLVPFKNCILLLKKKKASFQIWERAPFPRRIYSF